MRNPMVANSDFGWDSWKGESSDQIHIDNLFAWIRAHPCLFMTCLWLTQLFHDLLITCSLFIYNLSITCFGVFTIHSWLVLGLLMAAHTLLDLICSLLVRHFFITCLWLGQDLFMICTMLAHGLPMTQFVQDLILTCSWLVHDLFKTCSQVAHDLFMTSSRIANNLEVLTCLYLVHQLNMNFSLAFCCTPIAKLSSSW